MLFSVSQARGRLTILQCLANCRPSLPLRLRRVETVQSLLIPIERCYATSKPVSRPKAHTGRTTSTRKPKAAAAPKPAAKTKATTKKSTTAAKKSAPKKAAAKPKTKSKAKAKPKRKRAGRKGLTEAQKSKVVAKKKVSDLKALKETALKPPTGKPATAYLVYYVEKAQTKASTETIPTLAKTAGAEFKNLSTERREHYNHIANQNKAANVIQYRQWIESHTPEAIHTANNARLALRRKKEGAWRKLQDNREVKKPRTSYIIFAGERRRSGDFAGISPQDTTRRIAQEWKELSPEEKQRYLDQAAQDSARYKQEFKTVYNRGPR